MGIEQLPPGWLLILGALLIPLLRGRMKAIWLLAVPAAGLVHLVFFVPDGSGMVASMFEYDLVLVRVDSLARVWGTIFHIAAFIAALYALHLKDDVQQVAAFLYAGSAIGAVFAGDWITLFVYWELTAITSVWLVWASGTERAIRAGVRYLIVQVGSGVLLLAGVILHVRQTGSLEFTNLGGVNDAASLLIFVAMGIKAAFPFLHNWLEDAYPEATVTGTVWLSTFTTKLAIYGLARAFPGEALLIPIGAAMTAFPIFFAVIENDLRRVLAYSLNNQLGFMVVGIGIGTAASINGTAAHAFAHIIYKSLLFMSMGAVLFRTGTCKGSELGGLYKSMPWTCAFCIIGAASISAFPLTSGFISKSIILTEASNAHLAVVSLILLFASAGVFHHSGIKIPYFAFFAHDSGIRVKEAPPNMLNRDGNRGGDVHWDRRLSRAALRAASEPAGDIRPVHRPARRQSAPVVAVGRPRVQRPQLVSDLSSRAAVDQPRLRLGLSPRRSGRRECVRASHYVGSECRGHRGAGPPGLGDRSRPPPPRPAGSARPDIADRQHGALGRHPARRGAGALLHLISPRRSVQSSTLDERLGRSVRGIHERDVFRVAPRSVDGEKDERLFDQGQSMHRLFLEEE